MINIIKKVLRFFDNDTIDLIFLSYMLIVFSLKANPFLDETGVVYMMTLFMFFFGILRSVYLVYFYRKKLTECSLSYTIIPFMVSYFISIVLNSNFLFIQNIKDILWFFVLIFSVFFNMKFNSAQRNRIILRKIAILFITIITIMSAISIVFVFNNQGGYKVLEDGSVAKWGFLFQRLIGVYRSSNYASMYCIIAILLDSAFLLTPTRIRWKSLYAISLFLNLLYVIYSGSLTGKVCLYTSIVLVFLIILILNREHLRELANPKILFSQKKSRNYIIWVIAAFTLTLCVINFAKPAVILINSVKGVDSNHSLSTPVSVYGSNAMNISTSGFRPINTSTNEDSITFEREDFAKGIKPGETRLLHWKTAINVWKTRPWFGTTTRGYYGIAKAAFPKLTKAELIPYMENDAVTLLVCTGIVGTAIFLTFTIFVLIHVKRIFTKIIRTKDNLALLDALFAVAILINMLISALTMDVVIFVNALQSGVFWIVLGYLLSMGVEKND